MSIGPRSINNPIVSGPPQPDSNWVNPQQRNPFGTAREEILGRMTPQFNRSGMPTNWTPAVGSPFGLGPQTGGPLPQYDPTFQNPDLPPGFTTRALAVTGYMPGFGPGQQPQSNPRPELTGDDRFLGLPWWRQPSSMWDPNSFEGGLLHHDWMQTLDMSQPHSYAEFQRWLGEQQAAGLVGPDGRPTEQYMRQVHNTAPVTNEAGEVIGAQRIQQLGTDPTKTYVSGWGEGQIQRRPIEQFSRGRQRPSYGL